MTSPAREAIRIRCPGCGTVYDEWWHPSLHRALEEGAQRSVVSSRCPDCGHEVPHETLAVDDDGVLELTGLQDDD